MSILQKIEVVRGKPQYVRERVLLIAVAVAAAVLLVIWFATFNFRTSIKGGSFVEGIQNGVSNFFSDFPIGKSPAKTDSNVPATPEAAPDDTATQTSPTPPPAAQ